MNVEVGKDGGAVCGEPPAPPQMGKALVVVVGMGSSSAFTTRDGVLLADTVDGGGRLLSFAN